MGQPSRPCCQPFVNLNALATSASQGGIRRRRRGPGVWRGGGRWPLACAEVPGLADFPGGILMQHHPAHAPDLGRRPPDPPEQHQLQHPGDPELPHCDAVGDLIHSGASPGDDARPDRLMVRGVLSDITGTSLNMSITLPLPDRPQLLPPLPALSSRAGPKTNMCDQPGHRGRKRPGIGVPVRHYRSASAVC